MCADTIEIGSLDDGVIKTTEVRIQVVADDKDHIHLLVLVVIGLWLPGLRG